MPEPISLDEAVRRVLETAAPRGPLGLQRVPLSDALGRTLGEDIVATEPVPAFANSAMDGFAVRAADTVAASAEHGVELTIAGESRAGQPATAEVMPGAAVAISTGAMVPPGADAVVRIEDTDGGANGRVFVHEPAGEGLNVRLPGEDIEAGDRVLAAGTALGPAELGALAAVGRGAAPCVRRPRVAVLVTGDELAEPGETLRPGSIYNSNGVAIPAQVRAASAEVTGTQHVPDSPARTAAAVGEGLGGDILVVCGGVSVGAHDHVKAAFAEHGVREAFWGLKLRPGHPTWFGSTETTLVFGLPGNPVSAMVTFHLLVRPAIDALLGRTAGDRTAEAVLDAGYSKKAGRTHAIRCRLRGESDGWHATPTKEQGSHVLTSMIGADALALLGEELSEVPAGARVPIVLL